MRALRAMNGQSYVVRIYKRGPGLARRRGAKPSAGLIGIVENALTGERLAFHGVDELWAILARPATWNKGKRFSTTHSR